MFFIGPLIKRAIFNWHKTLFIVQLFSLQGKKNVLFTNAKKD